MDVYDWMASAGKEWVHFREGVWSDATAQQADGFDLVQQELERYAYEELHLFRDPQAGFRFAVAIHSTVRGPSLGGFRLYPYASGFKAVRDVMRLARGMTLKSAVVGLNLGGGKAVCWTDERGKTKGLLQSFARVLQRLEGRYITAEDVGTTPEDMDVIDAELERRAGPGVPCPPWVVCRSAARGGSGNPSPFTAAGIHQAIKIGLKRLCGSDSLGDRSIALQGLGNVGEALAKRLLAEGARLVLGELDAGRLGQVLRWEACENRCHIVRRGDIYDTPCDVLSPCAMGGILNDSTIPRLRCRLVAGSANNQLEDDARHAEMLQQRGILYAPDFVINSGGVINASMEYVARTRSVPYREAAVLQKIEEIFTNLSAIFDRAAREGVTPNQAALEIARERLRPGPPIP